MLLSHEPEAGFDYRDLLVLVPKKEKRAGLTRDDLIEIVADRKHFHTNYILSSSGVKKSRVWDVLKRLERIGVLKEDVEGHWLVLKPIPTLKSKLVGTNQKQALDLIKANPGITVNQLVLYMDAPYGTIVNIAKKYLKRGVLRREKNGSEYCWYHLEKEES